MQIHCHLLRSYSSVIEHKLEIVKVIYEVDKCKMRPGKYSVLHWALVLVVICKNVGGISVLSKSGLFCFICQTLISEIVMRNAV